MGNTVIGNGIVKPFWTEKNENKTGQRSLYRKRKMYTADLRNPFSRSLK